jgi:hypothetical protein
VNGAWVTECDDFSKTNTQLEREAAKRHDRQHQYRGYTITRGSYQGTQDDRLDGWYIDDPSSNTADRRGRGFPTLADAKRHIQAFTYENEKP